MAAATRFARATASFPPTHLHLHVLRLVLATALLCFAPVRCSTASSSTPSARSHDVQQAEMLVALDGAEAVAPPNSQHLIDVLQLHLPACIATAPHIGSRDVRSFSASNSSSSRRASPTSRSRDGRCGPELELRALPRDHFSFAERRQPTRTVHYLRISAADDTDAAGPTAADTDAAPHAVDVDVDVELELELHTSPSRAPDTVAARAATATGERLARPSATCTFLISDTSSAFKSNVVCRLLTLYSRFS